MGWFVFLKFKTRKLTYIKEGSLFGHLKFSSLKITSL